MTSLSPGASKYCGLKIHYLIFYFQIVLSGCNSYKWQLKSLILIQTFYRLPNKLKFMIKIRDCQQITLITLSRFCLLSVKAPTTLFIKGNINLDEIYQAILNEKKDMSVLHGISSFEGTS